MTRDNRQCDSMRVSFSSGDHTALLRVQGRDNIATVHSHCVYIVCDNHAMRQVQIRIVLRSPKFVLHTPCLFRFVISVVCITVEIWHVIVYIQALKIYIGTLL
jgi:hypothetical protein